MPTDWSTEIIVRGLVKSLLLEIAPDIIADLLAAESIPTNPVDAQDVQRLSPVVPRSGLLAATSSAPPSTIDFYDIQRFTGGGQF